MESSIFKFACGLVLILGTFAVSAVTVVECLDSAGNSSFRDKCPPGMSVKSTRVLRGTITDNRPTNESTIDEHPVVLFGAPQCEACALVRDHLHDRNVPFTEKNASKDNAIQRELAAITGAPLNVPTLTIGEQNITGYNSAKLNALLAAAGYQ